MTDLRPKTSIAGPAHQAWLRDAQDALGEAPFESLIARTADAVARGPLCTQDDLPDALHRLAGMSVPMLEGRPWHVTEMIDASNPEQANAVALEALRSGASALWLINPSPRTARILEGVHTDLVPVFMDYDLQHEDEDYQLNMSLGHAQGDEAENLRLPRFGTLDARPAHETGGTEVDELVFMALQYAVYHRSNVAIDRVRLSVGGDVHLQIAKLRAARRMLMALSQATHRPMPALHAVTSLRMMTAASPWTNLLRTQSASFAAVAGGAEYITTRAFTDAIGLPTDFARRIARNQQLLAMNEAHLGQVQDPAFGSYAHEALTQALSDKAWAQFQGYEAQGGLERQVYAFRDRLSASREALIKTAPPVLGVSFHTAPPLREAEVTKAYRPKFCGWGLSQFWTQDCHG